MFITSCCRQLSSSSSLPSRFIIITKNTTTATRTTNIKSSLPLDKSTVQNLFKRKFTADHTTSSSSSTTTCYHNYKVFGKCTDNIECLNKFLFCKKIINHHIQPIRRFSTSTPTTTTMTSQQITTDGGAQIISGKEVADEIRSKLRTKVEGLKVKPKLVIVQVGGREDSNVYIRMKLQFAESIGASAELIKLSNTVSEQEVASKIVELNGDSSVHGIITQLPFDCLQKIDSDKIVNLIDPKKDVDGLSVYNAGKLSHGELDSSSFVPCTPNGCMELIRKSGIQVAGSRSVVIGRSKIVGSPMAQLLLWHHSTVTICHSKTKNIDEICRQADIVVAAVGRPQMVKKSWLKPGAVVIDCGINVIPDATKKSGTRLVGDVDFEECKQVASAITPVPGGVGPMTVAMLIANTVESACRVEQQQKQ